MAIRNEAQSISLTAWNTVANAPETGDAGNISAFVSLDGAAETPSTNPVAELDAINCKGEYTLLLTAAEMNAEYVLVTGTSTTANVEVYPIKILTSPDFRPASFGEIGAVSLDTVSGSPGTAYPLGTITHPVDNLADAVIIAAAQNVDHLHIHGNLGALGQPLAGYVIDGDIGFLGAPFINLNNQDILGATFQHCLLIGQANGYAIYEDETILINVTGLVGHITRVEFSGTMGLADADSTFNDCYPLFGAVTFDCAALTAARHIRFHNWEGDISFINLTAGVVSFLGSGAMEVEASCTGGTINVRGIVDLTDNNGGTTVNDYTLSSGIDILESRLTAIRAANLDNLDQAISITESNIRGADGDDLTILSDQIDGLQGLEDADVYLDDTTVPWSIVWAREGTGGAPAPVVLVRKYLYDKDGNPITDLTTRLGMQLRDTL